MGPLALPLIALGFVLGAAAYVLLAWLVLRGLRAGFAALLGAYWGASSRSQEAEQRRRLARMSRAPAPTPTARAAPSPRRPDRRRMRPAA